MLRFTYLPLSDFSVHGIMVPFACELQA